MEKLNTQGEAYRLVYSHPHWPEIKQDLNKLKQKSLDIKQAEYVLSRFHFLTTSSKQFSCGFFFHVAEKDALPILSWAASLVLQFESKHPQFRIMTNQYVGSQKLSKPEVWLLFSLMTLYLTLPQEEMPADSKALTRYRWEYNFSKIFSSAINKAHFLVEYLRFAMKGTDAERPVELWRACVKPLSTSQWEGLEDPLCELQIMSDQTSIQDFPQTVKIDFANKYIGGGSLTHGNVQEQIMFLNRPEMYISILLNERMSHEEAIGFYGFKKYFQNKGYGGTLDFGGQESKTLYKLPTSEKQMIPDYIVGIDALARPKQQFAVRQILRELNKSLAGFQMFKQVDTITTGNWGCGVFNGDPQLKLIIQWISATKSGKKKVIYCPYGNKALNDAKKFVDCLKGAKAGKIAKALFSICEKPGSTAFKSVLSRL